MREFEKFLDDVYERVHYREYRKHLALKDDVDTEDYKYFDAFTLGMQTLYSELLKEKFRYEI